jgi:hypothetical protein
VSADRVPQPAAEAVNRLLEWRVLERGHPSARVAHHMVVVLPAWDHRLVAAAPFSHVDPLDEAHPVQEVDRAVDARDPDSPPLRAEPVGYLLGGQAAVLPREMLDDGAPRAAGPIPGALQPPVRPLGPLRSSALSHDGKDS